MCLTATCRPFGPANASRQVEPRVIPGARLRDLLKQFLVLHQRSSVFISGQEKNRYPNSVIVCTVPCAVTARAPYPWGVTPGYVEYRLWRKGGHRAVLHQRSSAVGFVLL
jgi:hypothetical protein